MTTYSHREWRTDRRNDAELSPIDIASLRAANAVLVQRVSTRDRELSKLRKLAANIVESMPDVVKVLDHAGRVVTTNSGVGAFNPFVKAGCLWTECWPKEAAEDIKAALNEARLGRKASFTASRPSGSGAVRWFDVLVVPLTAQSGQPGRILAISRDITSHRNLENELRLARDTAQFAAKAQAEFIATLSHELRTPITAVMSNLDLLDDDALAPDQRRRLARLQDASKGLLRIIDDVLDTAAIQAGTLSLTEQACDVSKLLENLCALMRPLAESKGLQVVFDAASSCPRNVVIDGGRLQQIVTNLVGNAIKFTKQGSVALSIAAARVEAGFCDLEIKVADTGIGISQPTRTAMFQRFSQLDPTIKHKYGGTGLGLAISRHLVEKMSGTIEVDSAVDEGSTFTIRLRCRTIDLETDPVEAATPPLAPAESQRSVLLVDDNPFHREVHAELLTTMGCDVKLAETGAEAVEAARHTDFDLIIIDQQMPFLNGSETADRIRDRAGSKRPTLVSCSANRFGDCDVLGGFDMHLTKPLTRAKLSPFLSPLGLPSKASPERGWFDPKLLARHRPAFEDALERLRLDLASDKPDAELAAKSHDLISSAAIFGLNGLAHALQELEASLRAHNDSPPRSEFIKKIGAWKQDLHITRCDRTIDLSHTAYALTS